jgi:ribonuclease P protein subunit POP4
MMITPYNVLRHELVGLKAKVIEAAHPGYIGIAGEVVDETKNTLALEVEGVKKKVPKDGAVFELTLPDKTRVRVDGKLLAERSEERVKKKIKIRF